MHFFVHFCYYNFHEGASKQEYVCAKLRCTKTVWAQTADFWLNKKLSLGKVKWKITNNYKMSLLSLIMSNLWSNCLNFFLFGKHKNCANVRKTITFALRTSGSSIDLYLTQNYCSILFLFEIPCWLYHAGISEMEGSSIDPQFLKCPYWITRSRVQT